jgi:hypothetical protein
MSGGFGEALIRRRGEDGEYDNKRAQHDTSPRLSRGQVKFLPPALDSPSPLSFTFP